MLGTCPQPVILIDGSDLKADRSVQLIRASLALHGRSLCLLLQVYPDTEAATPEAHQRFLGQLKNIVPVHAAAVKRRCRGGLACPGHVH
ncbi:MAG: hypothetical protein Q4F13_14120 [Pseudomonadota bacterium]|nr:hypothetical protein [Pseudomonadota bacterium]